MRKSGAWGWTTGTLVVILLIAATAGVLVGNHFGGDQVVGVDVAEARQRDTPAFHEVAGTVVAATALGVVSPQEGIIADVATRDGATVRQGELLVELQATAPQTALIAAEAEVHQLQATLEGAAAASTDTPTTGDTVALQAELQRAQKRLQAAKTAVEAHLVRAPVSGIVTLAGVANGDLVAAGQILAHIAAADRHLVEFAVPRDVETLRTADTVDVVGEDGAHTTAEITAEPATGATADVALSAMLPADAPLGTGDQVEVQLPLRAQEPRVVVPEAALVIGTQGLGLMLAVDDVARLVPIRVGIRQDGMIEVIGAVRPGDRVIVSNLDVIQDGTRIRAHGERKSLASTRPSA